MKDFVEVKNLEKKFKDKHVLNGISFTVNKGEILGFLGPNGAGKSTTINILTGALGYEGGDISFKGKDIKKNLLHFKQHIGVVPQDLAIYEDITAFQNVVFFSSLYGLKGEDRKKKAMEALEFVGLSSRAKDKVKTFSGGMKRRLNIACAIAHNPELLIMDEPTVGIDPQSRNHILNSIQKLRENHMTILYTTHYMEEVEEIATRIIIMDNGKIIASGTKEELKEDIEQERQYIMQVEDSTNINLDEFYSIEGVVNAEASENKITIATLKGIENLDNIIATAMKNGLKINELTSQCASLETVFLKLTGKKLRD